MTTIHQLHQNLVNAIVSGVGYFDDKVVISLRDGTEWIARRKAPYTISITAPNGQVFVFEIRDWVGTPKENDNPIH